MVQATGDVNYGALQAQADKLAAEGNKQPGLIGLVNGFRAKTPQLFVEVDRVKAKTMGVQLTDVFDALQAYLGKLLRQRLQLGPASAGPGQVNVPGRRPLPPGRGVRAAAQSAQRRRRHGAAGSGGQRARLHRTDPDHPL